MSFLNMGDPQITIGFNTILSAGWPIPLKNMSESQLGWWSSQYKEKQNMFHTTNLLWSNDLDDHYSQLSKSTRLCLLWDKKTSSTSNNITHFSAKLSLLHIVAVEWYELQQFEKPRHHNIWNNSCAVLIGAWKLGHELLSSVHYFGQRHTSLREYSRCPLVSL